MQLPHRRQPISGGTLETILNASTNNGNITLQNVAGTGAEVSFNAKGGAITSVSTPAAGGSGYPANSTFDLAVTGGGGSGGVVQATTNSSGVVTKFANLPDSPGNGYSTTGAANTTILLTLGELNAGTGTIQLDVNGTIYGATAKLANLTAGAVDLTTTGSGGSIGAVDPLKTAIDGELTATTNDGGVCITDSGPGLTINSVVADQLGQAPVVNNGQIVYNSMPGSSTPTYASGDENVSITSTGGPIVLNSVTATGDVTITSSAYILEGNAQAPNIVAQEVDLIANGTGDYQGEVTFANTNNATTGDTMTLPMGSNWLSFGFANGDSIYVEGAINSADKGVFTIATVVNNVLTLTPNDSYVLAPETQPDVTVGDGMIGLLNAAVSLSDVPIFVATTANGGIYLETGAVVNSTAYFVLAGGMNGMTNNVSVTSQANFLTVEDIIATGNAAVTANNGSLLEPSAHFGGLVNVNPPTNDGTATGSDESITAGTSWAGEGFAPGDLINFQFDISVSPSTDYTIASISADGDTLYLLPGETIAVGATPFVVVVAYGDINAQNVSLTSPNNIGTASSPFLTNATSGLTVAATATSPSSAAIYVDNYSPLTSIGVSTYDGSATIQSGYNGSNYAGSLSFANNVLSETGNAVVTFANTDYQDGSDGDVMISGPVHVSGISAGVGVNGTAGAGQILSLANSNATIDGNGGTVILSAGSGIGTPTTSIDIKDLTTLDATTTSGGIYIQNTASSAMTLSASASNGSIDVVSSGEIDLINESSASADSVSTTGTVTLVAGGAIVDENGSTVNASKLVLTATDGIGTIINPLETSSPGTLTLTASAGDGLFLVNNMALTVNSATAGNGDLSISSTGNLTLQGNVSSSSNDTSNPNVTLTATDGTLTTTGSVLISANSLAITAEQIGSANDVLQTSATTINATANFGGIYLSNNNSGVLTLSAAAVGPFTPQTNNVDIYSMGDIVLSPQTTNLTKLATALPVAVFNPGGILILNAGVTLSANGANATSWNSSATVTSADAGDTSPYYDVYTGTYEINGASQFSDNFSTSSSGGLDTTWTVQSGSFTVDTGSQTATATGTSGINLATVNSGDSINSVNESAQATISGTLASGQQAGLVALFNSVNSVNSYYYGSITATSSSSYTASIYSVVGGSTTQLGQTQSHTGSVKNAVLKFSVAGSSLTLLLNGTVIASATSSSITTAGAVGMLASSGVSFTNFISAPSLQIENNTAEVLVMMPGSPSSTNSLLDLTAAELEAAAAAGTPFIGGTIEIEDLGGTINLTGDLILISTAGPITFLNPLNTIDTSGKITITAFGVADLGNLTSSLATTGVNITISAGGNIGVGTINAGTGTVAITSSSGAIFNSTTGSSTLSITAGLLALQSPAQSNSSSAQSASSAASAAQAASTQAQINAAEAAATAQAAAALAAADQTTAAAFQAALTSSQAAVASDNLTYQADAVQTTRDGGTVNSDQAVVNADSIALDILDGIAGGNQVLASILGIEAAVSETEASLILDIPLLDTVDLSVSSAFSLASALAGLTEGIADVSIFIASSHLTAETIALITAQGIASGDQSAQDQADARLQADTDTETAFAAAYNVAEQAFASAQATSNQDQIASENAQQAASLAEANASAAANAASLSAAAKPPTLIVTGPVPAGQSNPLPGPVTITNVTGAAGINWTNSITSNSTVTETSQGPLTISGVTIQSGSSVMLTAGSDLDVSSGATIEPASTSTISSVALFAGGNVDVSSGATIEADATSPITITANTNDASTGATVTIDGTLSAKSASIGVDPNATGNETFTITPSATTPITVNGGSDSSGDNTLNFNAAGLAPTLSETVPGTYTITVAGKAPVTFTNIEIVNITNAAGGGSFTLMGLSGQANAMSLVGTGQGAGTATLNGVAISFGDLTSFSYQGGGAGDTITVTPFVTTQWSLAVTVDGGSGSPASLTYNSVDSLADTVTATGAGQGSIASPGLAMVQFKNVNEITTNAGQSPGDALTVNLPDSSSLVDTASLLKVGQGTADIAFGVFGLNVDTADYAGLTINGNTVGVNKLYLVTSTGAGLSIPLTLNYPDMHSVVNTGASTSVVATASGDVIAVTSAGLVGVTDLFGNVSSFAVTNTQLVFSDLGNNDTITVAGNNPFTNGIYVDGNASFSDIITYNPSSNAAVTVAPGKSTVSQAGAAVFYAGIQSLNLQAASGSTSTLTVDGSGAADAFDFTQTGAGAGSFTVVGPGPAINASPLFTYSGFGNGVTVKGGTTLGPALNVKTMTGNLATVTGYSYVNESVSATTTLTTGQFSGLVARYTGQYMDLGFVVAGSSSYTAYIYSDANGNALKPLFSQTYNVSVAASSTLMFDAVGSSLTLSLNGNIIGHATDTALASTAGSVGMFTSSGAVMSNFIAAPVTLQTASNSLIASLTTSSANGSLSASSIPQTGASQVNTSSGTATVAAPAAPATVNGTSNAKKTVSVTIKKVKTGQGVKSVRPVHEKLGHAHRAELRRQIGHGQRHQRDDGERQGQHQFE